MPIHLRAEPGDYADACLLPGDPLRAKYIAETYFDNAAQMNGERGLLGYTGEYEGKRVSVQGTGMGCPGATIVFEELIQLGVKKLVRVGTCGGLQPHHALGDLIVALSAVAADATAVHLVANEPHCPTASWSLIHGAVHVAKGLVQPRGARGRDGGGGAVHRRRAAQGRERLSADGQRHRRRGRVQADLRRRAEGGRRPDDPRRATHGHRRSLTASSWSTPPRTTGPRVDAGRSSPTAQRSSGSKVPRSSPSDRRTSSSSWRRPRPAAPSRWSPSAATAR